MYIYVILTLEMLDRLQFPWLRANTDSSTASQQKRFNHTTITVVPTNTVNLYHGDTNNNY